MAEQVTIEIVAIDLAEQVIEKVSNSLKNGLANAALAVGAAFVAGIGAAVLTLKDLSEAAGEAQLSQARFNTLVDSSSLADFKGEMLAAADALSKLTRFEDENILEAQAMLATYDTIGREIFPAVLDATLDLAEFMKTDATSAAQTLGRAFADIEGGSLSLLKRSRLLTVEQVEMAEKMAKAGDVAGAQALIIEALDGKIGDLAETMGQTFEGQKTIFMNALNDIKEDLGMKLLPILTPIIEKFGLLAEKYAPMLAAAFDQYIVPALSNAVDVFTKFLDALDQGKLKEFFEGIDWAGIGNTISTSLIDMSEAFKDWARAVDWQAVSDEISDGIDNIDWAGMGEDIRRFSANMWKGLEEAATEIDWEQIAVSLTDGFLNLLAGMTGQGNIDMVAKQWGDNFMQAFNIGAKLIEIGKTNGLAILIGTLAGMAGGLGLVVGWILNTFVPALVESLSKVKKAFFNAFQAAMQQAISAITGMKASVMKAVQDFMDKIRAIVGKGIEMAVSVSIPSMAAFAKMAATLAAGMAMLQDAMGGGGGAVGGMPWGGRPGTRPPAGRGIIGHAQGTNSAPKGWSWVGEKGPELVNFGGGEKVLNNRDSMAAKGESGGGGNLILNLTYAPAFSTSDKGELMSTLVPMLDEWYRRRLAS